MPTIPTWPNLGDQLAHRAPRCHETYMDTPYYEQLQYIGDTRIQALISYAVAGDDRLARQALLAFDQSRFPDGITRSRYPSSLPQNIPTFSLLYIGMLHDNWMYRPDAAFVKSLVPGTRTVLDWFAHYEQPDGLLREVPWWSLSTGSQKAKSLLTTRTTSPARRRLNTWRTDRRRRP